MPASLRRVLPALPALLALALAACGHTYRGSIGPTLAVDGPRERHVGGEAAVELGTHLIGSTVVGLPVSLRGQLTVLDDGRTEGLIGFAYGLWVAPGFKADRGDDESGLTLRASGAMGMWIGDDPELKGAFRAAVGLGHGTMRKGDATGSCSGGEKSRFCTRWTTWRARAFGAELAATRVLDDGDHPRLRATFAFTLEDVALEDFSFSL